MACQTVLDQDSLELAIFALIKAAWAEAGAWPEFVQVMRQSLLSGPQDQHFEACSPSWLQLVGLCCEAAGGDATDTHPAAGAWVLLYTAAHLLDSVQDGDSPDPWWDSIGAGAAINAATGLIFTASRLLGELSQSEFQSEIADRVAADFDQTILRMCSGQHADLVGERSALAQCWKIAEAKSGEFFSLACRTGATLAGAENEILTHYSRFGHALGLMIQMSDDLIDLQDDAQHCLHEFDRGRWSLPIAYYMEIASPEDKQRLSTLAVDPQCSSEFMNLIDEAGVKLYLSARIEQHRAMAIESLKRADAREPAKGELERMLR